MVKKALVAGLLLLALAVLQRTPDSPAVAAASVQGDVNCSSTITAVDSLQVLRSVAGLSTTAGCLVEAGDTNCDGNVNAVDALRILRHVAGLTNPVPGGCAAVGEPLGPIDEAEIGSPAQVSLTGASETSFNPLSSVAQFQITGANLSPDQEDVLFLMNGEPVPQPALNVSGNSISPDLVFQDGPNHLLLYASDESGLLVYYEGTIWAGDETLIVDVTDESSVPADGVAVTARLLDDPGVEETAISVSGQVVFENLPNRTILLSAVSGDDFGAETVIDLGAAAGFVGGAGSLTCPAIVAAGCSQAQLELAQTSFAIKSLVLNDIDNTPLRFLSTASHGYFGGNTRIHGTVTIVGAACDALQSLELEVLEGGAVVARANLGSDAAGKLLKPFPIGNKLEIKISQLLFELPSAEAANVNQTANGNVTLRAKARSVGGLEAEYVFGAVPKLVRYTNTNRYGSRNESLGGDDWVKPSVKTVADTAAGTLWDSFSNMNGGKFAGHEAHQTGNDIDGWYPGYNARDAGAAATMIGHLNNPAYGPQIKAVFVTFSKVQGEEGFSFWEAIKDVTLTDGRPARNVIRPKAGHPTHFHWVIPDTPGGDAPAQLAAGGKIGNGSGGTVMPSVATALPCRGATGTYHFNIGYYEDWTVVADIEWVEDPNYLFGCSCRVFFARGGIDWEVHHGWDVSYSDPPCQQTDMGHVEAGQGLSHEMDQHLILWEDPQNPDQYVYSGYGYVPATWYNDCTLGDYTGLTFFEIPVPDLNAPAPAPTPTPAPGTPPDPVVCEEGRFTVALDATSITGSCYHQSYTDPNEWLKYEWNFGLVAAP